MLKADLPQRFTRAFTNRSLSEIRTPRTPACHSNGMILAQAAGFVNTCCAKYFVLFTRAEPLSCSKVMQADDAFYRLAVADDDERRDAAHAEALRKAGFSSTSTLHILTLP